MHFRANRFLRRSQPGGPDLQTESNVFKNRHVPEQSVMLKNKAHSSFPRAPVGDVIAIEANRTGVRDFQSGNNSQ